MLPRRDSKPLEYAALLPMFGGIEKKPRFLDREVITLGRARGSDICLDGNEVSALHCIIFRASDGYRVRDCGSRTGTRINGQSIKNALLGNGDVIQIGPFSFEARIPRAFEQPAQPDTPNVEKLKRSRSRLAQAALRLRKKLATGGGKSKSHHGAADPVLNGKAEDLKAKIKQYDQRLNQLEESEQELLQEKEDLEKLRQEFQRQVKLREAELADQRKAMESEFQERWDGLQKELENLRRSAASGGSAQDAKQVQALKQELDAQKQKLDAQKKDLETLAQRLQVRDQEINEDTQALQEEREELDRLRLEMEEERVRNQKLLEEQRQELARTESQPPAALEAATQEVLQQKKQLTSMIEEVKRLQDELRHQGVADAAAYQAQIAELQKELQEARSSRFDEEQVRQLLADLDASQHENRQLRERVGDESRLAALETENATLRQQLEHAAALLPQANDVMQELNRVREENQTLKGLADELQQGFLSGHTPGNSELAALREENEVLKALATANRGESSGVNDEVREENQVLRRLLDEAESELHELKTGPNTDVARVVAEVRAENERLRTLLEEKVHSMPGTAENAGSTDGQDLESIRKEVQLLQELLREKDEIIEGFKEESEKCGISNPESYEAELNRFRKELEADRSKLNQEIDSLRLRNQELDEATREMEMELSRERAEMARERIRLDRMRDEVKADMEKLHREAEVRGTLAPVQKLRDELHQKNAAANGNEPKRVNDRLRSIRNIT